MSYAQPQPRFSVQSQSSVEHPSPTTSSTRFSLPTGNTPASNKLTRPNIYDRNLNKTRVSEVSASAFFFLFSEVVQYTQKRVSGINDLERRLNTLGYRIGQRTLELMVWRAESSSKTPKREIRFLPALMSIHTQVWKAVFGKAADAIEKSVENADEYMIIDNDPPIERHISVPRDMSQLSCSSFTAGIVEAVMDGLGFVAFAKSDITSINSYGYSPHPLSSYLGWVKELLSKSEGGPKKPFIISITSSDPDQLRTMVQDIQRLRAELANAHSFIAIELNTSCPNIPNAPPTGYDFPSLIPLLTILKEEYAKDPTSTIGLKLPPFVHRGQFTSVIDGIKSLCLSDSGSVPACPFAFFTCTNTLGNSLLFGEQSTRRPAPSMPSTPFAVPTGLGGLAGDALHALALGNVYTFSQLLCEPQNSSLGGVAVIGVGGVTSPAAAERMRQAGATVVGCATLLGKEGVKAFEIIGSKGIA
ncbi:hypothetical protein H0H92_007431 [Tricholoma furcatifolium]|nr:hypothetical protein H0H92_007431 [Tricholoma furcatifolium]